MGAATGADIVYERMSTPCAGRRALKGSQWKIGLGLEILFPRSILLIAFIRFYFFDLLFFSSFFLSFPEFESMEVLSSSLDRPSPSTFLPPFVYLVIPATFYTTTITKNPIHSSLNYSIPQIFFESRTIDDRLIINNGW